MVDKMLKGKIYLITAHRYSIKCLKMNSWNGNCKRNRKKDKKHVSLLKKWKNE